MNKAVFFDRDGVINVDGDFATDVSQIIFYESAPAVIAHCRKLGYKTFIVTNQAIVARGMITENKLHRLHEEYKTLLVKKNPNAIIDKIYFCPHHPNANLEEYRINCNCRKPKSGMILQAQREFDIDLAESFMIGDRVSDIAAGNYAGCRTVHLLSGKHNENPIVSDLKTDENIKSDFVIKGILELMEIIK